MRAKEKAKQIYDNINPYSHCKTDTYKLSYLLIDEIIAWELQCFGDVNKDSNEYGAIEFWQEVKQEIENL